MQNLSNCPVCNGKEAKQVMNCEDYTVSHEVFTIVACNSCGFRYTNPRPEENIIGKYYESDDYVSHSNSKKGLINSIYQIVRQYSLGQKVELLNKFSPKGKLLDIGCGTGEFLATAVKNGWIGSGVEPNEKARNQAILNHKLSVTDPNTLSTIQNQTFNVITMWHVLEHVHRLNEQVEDINRLLTRGGKAIIAVPNCSSFDATVYGNTWAAYDLPRHLYHFTPVTIKKLFVNHHLDFVAALPMKFDSYYVSMLTEKNVNKKNKLASAFLTGLRSNLKAKKDAEKFSSVIYVFEKK